MSPYPALFLTERRAASVEGRQGRDLAPVQYSYGHLFLLP